MSEKYYGEYPVRTELTIIKSDPDQTRLIKNWRCWRFDENHPWWKRLGNRLHYMAWWTCYVIRHRQFPYMLKEVIGKLHYNYAPASRIQITK
jgi:hypothetical protein